jgi:two-component system, NtrC family, response regulator AtoC
MVPPIIGESPVIQNIKNIIGKVAKTGENILICGETGVGKDLVAQNLYHQSNRVGKPFVKLNCACLTESFSEIDVSCFDKPETKDTSQQQCRLFDKIDGGILYLDNIDLLSSTHQLELLPFLENEDNPILDLQAPVTVDVYMISSTNQNLERMIKEGKFNERLYFRLSTVRIDIDPLRKRPEDIPFLIDYYYKKYASNNNNQKMISRNRKTMKELCTYHWPGNIRELQNVLKRIVFLEGTGESISDLIETSKINYNSDGNEKTEEMISQSNNLSDYFKLSESQMSSLPYKKARKKLLGLVEKELISNVLEETGWNRTKASKTLDISYKTLLWKIKELDIQPSERWKD